MHQDPVKSAAARSRRRLGLLLLAVVLTVEAVILAPHVGGALQALRTPDLRWLALAVVAELLSMLAFARVQRRMLASGGTRLSMRRMASLTLISNAMSVTLPAGPALGAGWTFRSLRSSGASVPAAGFTLLASGVLSGASFALLAVLGLGLAGGAGLSASLAAALLVGLAVGVAVLRRRASPELPDRLARRGLALVNVVRHRPRETGAAGVTGFIHDLRAIHPRPRDWSAAFGFAALNWVDDLVCLYAAGRAVHLDNASLSLVALAFVAGLSAGGLSLVPAGLGVVDAAMVLVLTGGGVPLALATATVVLYRLISLGLVAAVGWALFAVLASRGRLVRAPTPPSPLADGHPTPRPTPRPGPDPHGPEDLTVS